MAVIVRPLESIAETPSDIGVGVTRLSSTMNSKTAPNPHPSNAAFSPIQINFKRFLQIAFGFFHFFNLAIVTCKIVLNCCLSWEPSLCVNENFHHYVNGICSPSRRSANSSKLIRP